MISSFTVGNFKAFGPAQRIPLKPITLIFGPNSAGKSSVLHSLLLAHEALQSGKLDVFKTKLGGDSVDLGGFRQFTHRSLPENRISLSFDIPKFSASESPSWDLKNLSVTATYGIRRAEEKSKIAEIRELIAPPPGEDEDEENRPFAVQLERRRVLERLMSLADETGDDPPALLSYEISVDGAPILRASRKESAFKLDAIFLNHPALTEYLRNLLLALTLTDEISDESLAVAKEVAADLVSEIEFDLGGLLPMAFKKHAAAPVSGGPLVMKGAPDDVREQLRLILPFNFSKLIEAVAAEVSGFFSKLSYLGPLRSNPPRHLAFSEQDINSMAEGSFAWQAVRDDPALRSKVNTWLGREFLQTKYELGVDNLISTVVTSDALETALEEVISDKYEEWNEARNRSGDAEADEFFFNPYEAWDAKVVMRKLLRDIFARTAPGAVPELTIRDRRNQVYVSHRDIGIGVSQVLPVLVHAYASHSRVIAIEQPEIHLHPALQSELADVFIASAKGDGKNTFILETHSEHLILRLMRRIRETHQGQLPDESLALQPTDISVLYVEPSPREEYSVVREMPLNAKGQWVKAWPGGFFEEGLREILP